MLENISSCHHLRNNLILMLSYIQQYRNKFNQKVIIISKITCDAFCRPTYLLESFLQRFNPRFNLR